MKINPDDPLHVHNIVVAGSVADAIDLDPGVASIREDSFDRKRFPGAVWHMQDPKAVALIFSSGKIVLTGLMRQEDIAPALQNLLAMLAKAGICCTADPYVKVRNIVCTCNLGTGCNLVRIVAALMDREWVEYEPESFPGLVCRISDPKVVVLLFSSGKAVITGGTNMADVRRGLGVFMEKLEGIGAL